MSRLATYARRTAIAVGGVAVGLAAILAVAFVWAQSEGGRRQIARGLEAVLSSPGVREVAIERLEGRLPQELTILGLEVRDMEGPWLRAERLALVWRPLDLLSDTLRVEALTLDAVTIERSPRAPAGETGEAPDLSPPRLPFEIALDKLAVESLVLNEAVLGVPATLRVEAEVSTRKSNDLIASLLVERIEGEAGRLQGRIQYDWANRHLAIAGSASEPPGGLLARALGLPDLPAFEASVAGAGPLDDWRGTLEADFSGLARTEADLRLAGLEALEFELTGEADTTTASTELPWPLLGPRAHYAAKGSWRDEGVLNFDRAELRSGAGEVQLRGSVDTRTNRVEASLAGSLAENRLVPQLIEDARSGQLTFEAKIGGSTDDSEVEFLAATGSLSVRDVAARGVMLDGSARGPLWRPRLQARVTAEALTSPRFTAEAVSAEFEFEPDGPLSGGPIGGRFQIGGTASYPRLPGIPEAQDVLGEALEWSLDGRLERQTQVLQAERVLVAADKASVAGGGWLDLGSQAATAELSLDLRDIGALAPLLPIDAGGTAVFKVNIGANDLGSDMTARLSGELRDLAIAEPFVGSLVQDRMSLDAEVTLDYGGSLAIENIEATAPHVELRGNLRLLDGFETLQADYSLAMPDLAVLELPADTALGGGARLGGSASGPVADPLLAGRLELIEPRFGGYGLKRIDLDFKARDLGGEPRGSVTTLASTPMGEVSGSTGFRLQRDVLRLEGLGLEAGKSRASGQVAVPLGGEPIGADIEFAIADLGPWLELGGLQGKGAGRAKLKLFAADARQAASLEAGADGIALALPGGDRLLLQRLDASLTGSDLLSDPRTAGKVSANGLALGALKLDRLSIEGSGGLAGGSAQILAAGSWIEPLELSAAANLSRSGQALSIEVARLEGKGLGEELRSLREARLELKPGLLDLSGLDLRFGSARVQGSARHEAEALAADIRVSDLPVSALRPLWSGPSASGRISADLALSGTPENPRGQLSLAVTELRADAVDVGAPLNLAVEGGWRDGQLDLTGTVGGLGREVALFSAALPLRPDPSGFVPRLPAGEPISGTLRWNGRIEEVWSLVPIDGHEVEGQCTLGLELAGTLERPLLAGRLAITDGTYENFETGTLLRKLELAAELDGDRIELAKLEAEDGDDGRVSATGNGVVDPESGLTFRLDGDLSSFALVRRDDLTARTDGDLTLEGSLRSAALTGRLQTRGVEIRIPDRLPPQVVELAVIEAAKGPAAAPPKQEAPQERTATRLDLDLSVEMPDRVFVRGRGLDSEWAGRLHAGGTAEEPALTGKLELVRGRLSLLGKDFTLNRGTIEFLGGKAIDPVIDAEAVATRKDLSVTLGLTGPVSNPEVRLTSVPPYPRDEIVARLLFDKGTAQLTALEAAQLAAAVAQLTGADGGGPSVFDMARGALGVDVLRLETATVGDTEAPALSVGKYLTDGVYVGVKRGAAAETGAVTVEVEVTPNISIESEVGETGQSKVGIKFKWDY